MCLCILTLHACGMCLCVLTLCGSGMCLCVLTLHGMCLCVLTLHGMCLCVLTLNDSGMCLCVLILNGSSMCPHSEWQCVCMCLSVFTLSVCPHTAVLLCVHIIMCRGLDPIMFSALCGVASGIAGFVAGGAMFTATWKLIARKQYQELEKVPHTLQKQCEVT